MFSVLSMSLEYSGSVLCRQLSSLSNDLINKKLIFIYTVFKKRIYISNNTLQRSQIYELRESFLLTLHLFL